MTYKYITIVTFTLLSACTQEPQETDKINKSPTNSVPEVNHSNCQFDHIKSISNKYIQQTLADNCMRRSTTQPTVNHKNWTIR
jgi:entry exclusion lipoprotein TrbK